MKSKVRGLFLFALVALTGALVPSKALAQNPPAGAIYDLSNYYSGTFSSTYVPLSTSFVADSSTEYVSFAFREVPAYFSLDDTCVAAATSNCGAGNLLTDPGFESDTAANVLTNFPVGWFRWIQPVDTSAIGVVASTTSLYGCASSGPRTGTYFWCDGSVQGYDAIYQQLTNLTVGATYNVSWYLADNSGQSISNPGIDMLVYAGDSIPVGSVPIGTTPTGVTPEPSTFVMLGTGMAGLLSALRARRKV